MLHKNRINIPSSVKYYKNGMNDFIQVNHTVFYFWKGGIFNE